MVIKNAEQTELRKQRFVKDYGNELAIWSLDKLNQLSSDELVDRYIQVDQQSFLIKCRILWALRQKYASDTEFGAYTKYVRETSANPIWASGSSDMTRSIAAGRFFERHAITDFKALGIGKTVIYELGGLKDEAIADELFNDIRSNPTINGSDAVQMINAAKLRIKQGDVVATQYQEPKIVDLSHDNVKVVREQEEVIIEPEIEEIELEEDTFSQTIQQIEDDEAVNNNVSRRLDMIHVLAGEDASYLTVEQQKHELAMVLRSYKQSFLKDAGLLRELSKEISAGGYGK
jgi:hypothetical protein